ncbi:unnamed protein product [Phytophthora fragariaefolia]|uniref:Unnamed protein product n=1 Tax=Phytophthora fragariaefolia TaxID=1490495 RepID=A0A9W6UCX4_9STRA|nr:unnamed protein product [Phytophthora fragariaefolia]
MMDLGFHIEPTMEGYKVYLHGLDEGSRYQWILQQNKEETAQKLVEFSDHVKARFGKMVNIFHSDQGPEFTCRDVARMCAGESIQIFAHPHTAEEVYLVEKAHDVMMNKERTIMYSSGLSDILWGEAAAYVFETTNRTSIKGNKDQVTPHEKIFGTKPSVRHLRSFGCFAVKFADKVYRDNKLSRRGAPTLLLGYAVKAKGYRFLDLATGVICEHRAENVKFYEQTTVSKDYVDKLLNTVYRLRRRPDVDSTRLPVETLPVAEVPENDRNDQDHGHVESEHESETSRRERFESPPVQEHRDLEKKSGRRVIKR